MVGTTTPGRDVVARETAALAAPITDDRDADTRPPTTAERVHDRAARSVVITVITVHAVPRGHVYRSATGDGDGPCVVCGYGPAAPQHQPGPWTGERAGGRVVGWGAW